jgi:O-antigen/teichoic acid export membrane protein
MRRRSVAADAGAVPMDSPSPSLRGGILISTAGVFGSAFLWLLSFKAVALWMGPEGVGLFSQLRQMAQAATVGATFGGTNSVVQGLSERGEEAARRQFRATAARLVGAAGVLVVLAILVAATPLTRFFLSSDAPELVATVRWLALAVLLNVAGTYAMAVLNGYRTYPYLALAQIAGPAALVLLLACAWWWRWAADPMLLAASFVLCFGVTCLAGLFGMSRLPRLAAPLPAPFLAKAESRVFLRFALSNLGAALSTTLALLLIRSWVIEARGLAFAGLFDAGWTLTFNYTTLFLTACSAIYLPLLTRATDAQSQKACMLRTAYLVLAGGVLVCYCMVLLKEPLINLLYSHEFQPSGQVLAVLVIAVICRSISWVYGTMILATRNSRVLLLSDLALNLGLLATVKFALVNFSTLSALAWAFVLPNFLYLVFVVEYAAHKNPLMRRWHIWPLLLAAIFPLVVLVFTGAGPAQEWAIEQWFCIVVGPAVAAASLVAYKKVVL